MKKRQFIILILLLVIGFASVTTTLVLNGKVGIGVELDDYDVIFIEALLDGKEDTKVTISEDKKTITFTTDKFINPGDSTRLDYKVKNTSTQYDADVTINCTNEASEYVTVESSFDGNSLPLENLVNMKAQEVKNGYINAELAKAYPGDDTSIEISCSIDFTATSRETYAYSLSFNSNGGSKIDDKSVVLNDSYGELSIPEREGYNFLGWYDEEDNKVDSSTVFDTKGNRNLYAKWEEKVYDLDIVTIKDGESKTNTIGIKYGNKVQISINEKNYYISKMECSDGYSIEDYNLVIPTYGEQKPNIKNNKVYKGGSCTFTLSQGIFEYNYTGSEQLFSVPLNGEYKFETWGAGVSGAGGAYTSGNISLVKNTSLYVYVGGQQQLQSNVTVFNSGTKSIYQSGGYRGFSSSGATDIRTINGAYNATNSLISRIMVSAGSGSHNNINNRCSGGVGGGLNGYNGTTSPSINSYGHTDGGAGRGASQTAGGISFNSSAGIFGIGAQGVPFDATDFAGSGGGGWYGGGAGYDWDNYGCGGGGSSYISGHTGSVAVTSLSSSTPKSGCTTGTTNNACSISPTNYVFTNTTMIDGAGYSWSYIRISYTGMPTHDGTGTMTGNSGNGYAKITLISID